MARNEQQPLIGSAQRIKREVFAPDAERVEVNLPIAALALGISIGDLESLKERGRIFKVEPTGKGTLWMSLEPQAPQRARDLWQEMLASLEKGRSAASEAMKEYRTTYFKCQREKNLTDSDKELYQIHLQILWTIIPDGLQREMTDISPDRVWRSMQIV